MARDSRGLRESLEQLELILDTPVVPGELASWARSLQEVATRTGVELRHQIEQVHRQQYGEMREANLEMERRVEQLQAADEELLEQYARFSQEVQQLAAQAARIEPDEAQTLDSLPATVERGLQLVVAARKQETAVSVWLQEAFNRDRGDVD